MSSLTSTSAPRVEQLGRFLHALEISKGRSDAFKALSTTDRSRLLKVLMSNKSLKIQPNNLASIDWNKGKNLVIGPIKQLLQGAKKCKPVLSTQSVAKTHFHQFIGSSQLVHNSRWPLFLSSQDFRSLHGVCRETAEYAAIGVKHAVTNIKKYNLEPLIAKYSHTEIHTKTDSLIGLREVSLLGCKLSRVEQLRHPTFQTLGKFFELVEAGNLLRMRSELIHQYPVTSTINDFIKNEGGVDKLLEQAEHVRTKFMSGDFVNSTRDLDLSYRGMTLVPKEIGRLKNLQELNLTENPLYILTQEIGHLDSLKTLHLNGNQLVSLPKEICGLKSLEILGLENNQLISLPKEIGKLKALTELWLNENRLTGLPKEISQLKALIKLYLSTNPLPSLPKEIGQLQALQELDISYTRLTRLPKEFENLQSLRTLSATMTPLEIFPQEICQLIALQKLVLVGNAFSSIPKEIGELQALRDLTITLNSKIVHVAKEIGQLNGLTSLILRNTNVRRLPNEIGMLPALTYLDLGCNGLSGLPKGIGQIPGLKKPALGNAPLDFKENGIVALPDDLADYVDQLQHQKQDVQKQTLLNQLKDALKKNHDCKKISALLEKMEKIVGKESRSHLHRELALVCKKDPKLGKNSQKLGFGRQAFLDPKVDPKLKLTAIERVLNPQVITKLQKIVETVQVKQKKQVVQKQTILNQLKDMLKRGHDCKKIASLLDAMEKNFGKERRSDLHRELAQVCKKDPKWCKETRKPGFGRQAFLNPKVDPKLKLIAIEQVLSQVTKK